MTESRLLHTCTAECHRISEKVDDLAREPVDTTHPFCWTTLLPCESPFTNPVSAFRFVFLSTPYDTGKKDRACFIYREMEAQRRHG